MKTYPTAYRPNHPLAPPSGYIATHRVVLYDRIGPGPHACHWCGKMVDWAVGTKRKGDVLLADHVDGDRQNLAPENLVPACNACNVRRAHPMTIQDGELAMPSAEWQTRAVEVTCAGCGTSFLHRASGFDAKKQYFCTRECSLIYGRQRRANLIHADELTVIVGLGDKAKPVRAKQLTCERCGTTFLIPASTARRGGRRYCSRACYFAAARET